MIGINLFSPIPLADPNTADRGIVTGVPPESERIEVQPGDVVGFYLESSMNDDDGIRFDRDNYNEETVWFVTDTASIVSPMPATLSVGPSGLLSVSTNLAPLISVCKYLSLGGCVIINYIPTCLYSCITIHISANIYSLAKFYASLLIATSLALLIYLFV